MKMKDKKAVQVEKKRRHKKRMQEARARRKARTGLERKAPDREEKPVILIVCEGENTEPSYFRQFRVSSAVIEALGEGYNTLSLVERTEELIEGKNYDQIWCVFDKDDYENHQFDNAIKKAEGKGFKVAYSNQAFEYWLLLHFEDHQGGGMHRDLCKEKLDQYLQEYGEKYEDNKLISEKIFLILIGIDPGTERSRTELAISRARKIYERLEHYSPAKEESSTTVFKLVEELQRFS